MNVRILQRFVLRSPLSHIAESIGTSSFLVQEPVLQPDGSVEEVFVYSGNAWRGALRDLMATYLLERLDNPTVALDAFHLLYSGGAIGGPQQTDIEQARRMRRLIPPLALLGGGVGNQILPGKLRVSNLYPVCREAPAIPGMEEHRLRRVVSYRQLTTEKSHTRKDDSKDPRYNHVLERATPALPDPESGQAELPLADRKRQEKEPAQQMRFTVELVIAGTELLGFIDAEDVSEVELGCLVSAYYLFSRSPFLGGQAARGYGLVSLETTMVDRDTGEVIRPFVAVADRCLLSPRAEQAKQAYDEHLLHLYTAAIESQAGVIKALIGGAR